MTGGEGSPSASAAAGQAQMRQLTLWSLSRGSLAAGKKKLLENVDIPGVGVGRGIRRAAAQYGRDNRDGRRPKRARSERAGNWATSYEWCYDSSLLVAGCCDLSASGPGAKHKGRQCTERAVPDRLY
jgi:hypothetical protein